MNVLVTGGAGFIGSNLVRCLVAAGDRVRVLDDLSTGSSDNLRDCNGLLELRVGDVRDPDAVRKATDGVEVVHHLAALPPSPHSGGPLVAVDQVNVQGTLNVLVAALEAGVRRVVYASSSSVYGDAPSLPAHEDLPTAPLSPHAASKLAGEAYCRAFTSAYGLETVSLRLFNVFGPRQGSYSEASAVIPRFVTRMLIGSPPEVFGDGRQSRDFTYVSNAVQACVLASSAGARAAGECMNVACGHRITLLELVRGINEELGIGVDPVHLPPRPGDVRHSEGAIGKAERLIDYRPLVTLQEGLAQTVRWFARRVRAPRSIGDRLTAARGQTAAGAVNTGAYRSERPVGGDRAGGRADKTYPGSATKDTAAIGWPGGGSPLRLGRRRGGDHGQEG